MVLEMAVYILGKYNNTCNVRYVALHDTVYSLLIISWSHCSIHQPVCKACYELIKVYLLGQSRWVATYMYEEN